uniref:Uncharacterized protein n=1 Tax=Amphora coffeiformis TaxID=265554 RepID=A0A7S3L8G9_9STRA|mmetsp:Transcript_22643/g.42962  ORF Transcript_22643/g.42962 Transcript_22643/m.42962 type:complete len:438 (+) Transcript_22643:42-1355(+)
MRMMSMMRMFLSFSLVFSYGVSAFAPVMHHHSPLLRRGGFVRGSTRPTSSSARWYARGEEPAKGTWKVINDFPTFLNQVTLQSFLFVLGSLRDPHTVRWVDAFCQPVYPEIEHKSARLTGTTDATTTMMADNNNENSPITNPNGKASTRLLIYHGIGCMNTTAFPHWSSFFEQLLARPVESYIIQSHNGLTPDYDMEINPASLCTRIISVREQIAKELAHDLGIVARMGYHTMDTYWEYWDNHDISTTENRKDQDNEASAPPPPPGDRITMSSGADVKRRLPPHNLVFLDYSLAGSGDMAPSPLRKGNFDLVVLLATQESICRILNNQQLEELKRSEQHVYRQFLQKFYIERLESHFTGIQRYGRADDFLEELLFSVGTAVVDPVRLTEIILREREQVALEWQAMSQDVPNDHIVIKRLQLEKLMESYNTPKESEQS